MEKLYPPMENDQTGDDDVLSPQLRRNFKTLRDIVEKSEETSKKRKEPPPSDNEDEGTSDVSRAKKLAIETAIAVEAEVTRLRNGIAELEALLAEQQEEGAELQVFPDLPPVIHVHECPEEDFDDSRRDATNGKMKNGELVHG